MLVSIRLFGLFVDVCFEACSQMCPAFTPQTRVPTRMPSLFMWCQSRGWLGSDNRDRWKRPEDTMGLPWYMKHSNRFLEVTPFCWKKTMGIAIETVPIDPVFYLTAIFSDDTEVLDVVLLIPNCSLGAFVPGSQHRKYSWYLPDVNWQVVLLFLFDKAYIGVSEAVVAKLQKTESRT